MITDLISRSHPNLSPQTHGLGTTETSLRIAMRFASDGDGE